jgi:hypothetical protein
VAAGAGSTLVQLVTKSPLRHSQPLPSAGSVTTCGSVNAIDSNTTTQAIVPEAIARIRYLRQPMVIGVSPVQVQTIGPGSRTACEANHMQLLRGATNSSADHLILDRRFSSQLFMGSLAVNGHFWGDLQVPRTVHPLRIARAPVAAHVTTQKHQAKRKM